ncbi:MAG: hypothetical protein Q4G49_17240 [Paracoccus sp. (in: a-proteobacteria)]|nr:hypothetical protein [Paracoccus sp. (in: a-proteobacteria)]
MRVIPAACLLLAACTTSPEFLAAERLNENPAPVHAMLAATTVKSYSRAHGTQIEYLAPDGRSFLLYPGNRMILPGEWQIRGSGPIKGEMCFRYGANTYNPVTGARGSAWECGFLTDYLVYNDEIRDGDILNLSRRTQPPARLPKGVNLTIAQVQAMWGLPPTDAPNKSIAPR